MMSDVKKLLQNLASCCILSRLSRENGIFFAFAAPKFGGIENNSYICTIETIKARKYARSIQIFWILVLLL